MTFEVGNVVRIIDDTQYYGTLGLIGVVVGRDEFIATVDPKSELLSVQILYKEILPFYPKEIELVEKVVP